MPLALCALSEFLALLLTIVRTLEIRRVMWTAGVRHSYTHLLVREGTRYYSVLFFEAKQGRRCRVLRASHIITAVGHPC